MTKFTNVIVRKPGKSLCNGITSAPELGQPIYERAVAEHDDYIAALKQCGVEAVSYTHLEVYKRQVQLGDEHGGHAVDRRRLLLVEGLKHQLGIELLNDEHGAAVGEAGHDPQHAAEAVEERHRQAHTVFGTELLSLADVEAVSYTHLIAKPLRKAEYLKTCDPFFPDDLYTGSLNLIPWSPGRRHVSRRTEAMSQSAGRQRGEHQWKQSAPSSIRPMFGKGKVLLPSRCL